MKKYILILVLLIAFAGFSQDNYILKTDDGRRVLLKADFTWKYIDTNIAVIESNVNKQACHIEVGFEEPKLNSKIQNQLKRGRAAIDDVKKKVAKDYECDITDVLLLNVSEQKAKALYHFCANGKKATYKRIGNAIIAASSLFK